MFLLVVDDAGKHKVFPQAELICRRSLLIKSKPELAGERGVYTRSRSRARMMACARLCTPSLPQRL